MAQLGQMILNLSRQEMRALFYLIKSAPYFVSAQKLCLVARDQSVSINHRIEANYGRVLVKGIRNKLGVFADIKGRWGCGYVYERIEDDKEM